MDYKLKNLRDKIYRNYIRGEYGDPKIPNRDEVLAKLLEITDADNTPIIKNDKMDDLDIDKISSQFHSALDDIDILFDSVEDESEQILEQLTNSLKEHNGVKRELQRINERADDISAGKLGEDYIRYTHTETFNNLENIDGFKSDPVDLEARLFTIKRNASKVLSLDHYRGSKLEFSIVQNFARLETYGYIGNPDASVILDPNDSRSITYQIITNNITPIRAISSIQLTPTSQPVEINGVTLDIDSRVNKGQVRIYYRGDDAAWHDVKPISIKDIQGDRVAFNFDSVNTSHIKLEFIKPVPDVPASREYLITIRSLSIYRTNTMLQSVLQSKPIVIDSYSEEHPIVDSLKAFIDADKPHGSSTQLYIAKDIPVSGAFKDINGNVVEPESANIYKFDQSYDDTVFLSQLKNVPETVSGVAIYKGMDYEWIELQDNKTTGGVVSKVVGFNLASPVERMDNSLYTQGGPSYLFGDSRYGGPWPADGGDWYYSGWCNNANPLWGTYLEDMVNSGIFASGVDVATIEGVSWNDIEDEYGNLHPDISGSPLYSGQWLGYGSGVGYPFGYIEPSDSGAILFGEYGASVNGWWRPAVEAVGPGGLKDGYIDTDGSLLSAHRSVVPDFHFNGSNFWKVYKFGTTEKVLSPSVKVYTYQERPIFGADRYYPHNFIWKYKSSWEIRTATALEQSVPNATGWAGYTLPITGLFSNNEEYIFDGISEVRVHNTNVVLDSEDMILKPVSSTPSGIDLSLLESRRLNLVPEGASFDITYSFKAKNIYQSTWTSFAIVSSSASDPTITIPNIQIYRKEGIPIINKIDVENLDTGEVETVEATDDLFVLRFNTSSEDRADVHYKITIYCASDEDTGFCAKYNQFHSWVPYHSMDRKSITVSTGIKLVAHLSPLTVVDLGSLVYDSSIYNSRKAALYSALYVTKFIVVKQPSKDIFPGYYFHVLTRQYEDYLPAKIENKGHWIRRTYNNDFSNTFTYTTGSSGVNPGSIYNTEYLASGEIVDPSWNNGSCLVKYPNSSGNTFFPVHSTFGYPINVDDEEEIPFNGVIREGDVDPRAPVIESGYIQSPESLLWLSGTFNDDYNEYLRNGQYPIRGTTLSNKGFLFYNTAENLPTYYSIAYKIIEAEEDNNSRFLYKLVLTSDNDSNVVPVVRSIKFVANEG
jgi:hypothetical protein